MSGISGLLGAVALLGFLLFIAGIGLAVAAASQGRTMRGGVVLAVLGLFLGLIFSVVGQGILIVQPNEVAVVFQTITGDLENPRGPGTHVIVPVVQSAEIYPVSFNTYTQDDSAGQGAITARTIDGQEVLIEVSVVYRIDPAQVNTVHQRWQNRYEDELIVPVLRGFMRDVVSGFRAEAVYSSAREQIQQEIEELMRERLTTEGLELSDLIIRDVSFSNAEFAQSIEQVQIAERRSQEAEQAAERARIQAGGERDAEIARAEGAAQAIILRAQAQAEALRLVSEQIAANPSLIQYEYIQNLADNVRLVLVPSNSPFLFDFESLGAANPDFQAPDAVIPTPAP